MQTNIAEAFDHMEKTNAANMAISSLIADFYINEYLPAIDILISACNKIKELEAINGNFKTFIAQVVNLNESVHDLNDDALLGDNDYKEGLASPYNALFDLCLNNDPLIGDMPENRNSFSPLEPSLPSTEILTTYGPNAVNSLRKELAELVKQAHEIEKLHKTITDIEEATLGVLISCTIQEANNEDSTTFN